MERIDIGVCETCVYSCETSKRYKKEKKKYVRENSKLILLYMKSNCRMISDAKRIMFLIYLLRFF